MSLSSCRLAVSLSFRRPDASRSFRRLSASMSSRRRAVPLASAPFRRRALALAALLLLAAAPGLAGGPDLSPARKPDGEKWRVGYYQGGDYNDYAPVLRATVQRLIGLGWIAPEAGECAGQAESPRAVWDCLAATPGDFLSFVPDAFWSADWKEDARKANRADFLKRAGGRRDLDLVLALGTWAGQDLATSEHDIPVVVCSTSNAVFSGIVKSAEDSGLDHVHARVDPTRYARQVKLFHDVVGFRKLGVVHENSLEGISYAGLDQIRPLARDIGFEIVACEAPFVGVAQEEAERAVLACHEKLAGEVDALYITIHRGVNQKSLPALLRPLFEKKIPTFAMGTLHEVNAGAMMSMAQTDFRYAGNFYGEVMARVLKGERPRDISQILPDPQDVRVNIEAARRIGVHIPVDILYEAKETVRGIEGEQPAPAAP